MKKTLIRTNDFLGENTLNRSIASTPTVKLLKFSNRELIQIAQSTKIGRNRLKAAEPFLLKEFGIPTRIKESQSYQLYLDWETVPYTVILDYVFGLDQTINFRGWNIGIDATTNSEVLGEKLAKLNWLKPLWKPLGIDHTAVCQVGKTGGDLITGLRSIIKGARTIQLAI